LPDEWVATPHNGVAGPAKFERPDFLEILAFEKKRRFQHPVKGGAGKHRRAVGVRANALRCLPDIIQGRDGCHNLLS